MKLIEIYDSIFESDVDGVTLYHGTSYDFDKFDLRFFNAGSGDGGWLGKGVYLTNDYDYASSYGDVLECTVRLDNPYILKDSLYQTRPLKLMNDLGVNNSRDVTMKLRSDGYDSIILTYDDSDIDSGVFYEVCVFDPSKIKIIKRYEGDEA